MVPVVFFLDVAKEVSCKEGSVQWHFPSCRPSPRFSRHCERSVHPQYSHRPTAADPLAHASPGSAGEGDFTERTKSANPVVLDSLLYPLLCQLMWSRLQLLRSRSCHAAGDRFVLRRSRNRTNSAGTVRTAFPKAERPDMEDFMYNGRKRPSNISEFELVSGS